MGVDHGLAPVQFGPNGSKGLIAQPPVAITGEQADTIGFERVEGILDLPQAAFDIRHR